MRKLRVVFEQHVSGTDRDYSARDFRRDVRSVFDEWALLARQRDARPALEFSRIDIVEFNMVVGNLDRKNLSKTYGAIIKAEKQMQVALRRAEQAIRQYNELAFTTGDPQADDEVAS